MTALRPLRVGDRAEKELLLTREDVIRLATELGDPNPLHHDERIAAASRFGGLIASGGHLIGLLTSFCAAFTTSRGPGVGLGFSYELRRAARVGTPLRLRWEVTAVDRSEKLRGEVVTLEGAIEDARDGAVLVTGAGRVLAREDLG
jgi:3-hydroxybutyryl-CoA dehydratase